MYLKCPVCGHASIDGSTHLICKRRLRLDGLISFFPYSGIIQKAVKTIKYRYAYTVTEDLMRYVSSLKLPKQSILIPIPLYVSRHRFRGFNQAEILARAIEKKFDIPVRTDVLKRVIKTVPQVEMKNREKRLSNMNGAFIINNEEISTLLHKTIVLVDDVYTTGATIQSACETLKREGVKIVWGLTIAQ